MINKIRAELLFSKGQNQAKQGLWEKSIKSFDRALSCNPVYSGIYLHKALSLSKLKEYHSAQSAFTTAIEMQPRNPAYHLFMGIFQYDRKNYDEALVAFENTLKLSRESYLALCYRSLIFLVQGKSCDEASDNLRKYLIYANHDFKSRFLEFCENICFQNRTSGRSFDVFHELNSEISNKKSSNIIHSLSVALMSWYYDMLYLPMPLKKSAYKHYNKAIKAQLTDQFEEAIKEYRQALKIYPEFKDAEDKLIELYWNNKSYQSFLIFIKEIRVYREVTSLIANYRRPSNDAKSLENDIMKHSYFVFMIAYAYYQTGDYENAFELLLMLSKHTKNPLVFYYLGVFYIRRNMTDEAHSSFLLSLENLLDQEVLYDRLKVTIALLTKSKKYG